MAPKHRVIIDTDPGVDDVMALLLALSASPEELEVAMISVTYGNVPIQRCLRNVVALFHVLEKEMAWRESTGKPTYGALGAYKPIVAVGAEHALEDEQLVADHFHGADGLHGVHDAHPHLSPADTWRTLFEDAPTEPSSSVEPPSYSRFFTPSKTLAHKEILRLLKEEPEDTITIIAIGPLTNVALAASEDPETFLRVKELVVMGGAVEVEGNVTPCAEFNCMADAVAAARVFALTSLVPSATMPPVIHGKSFLPPYPAKLSRQLKLTLFPLDITTPHELKKRGFNAKVQPLMDSSSPLAQWTETFMNGTFNKIDSMLGMGHDAGLSLHDPLCIWYMLTRDHPGWKTVPKLEDIRIETSGQWTRGMHVIDKRGLAKPAELDSTVETHPADPMDAVTLDEIPGDTDGWLSLRKGNRINRVVGSPSLDTFANILLEKIFA
ncbi:Inosine/uridine-preferring nucleoside hydrolase domain-containing protein [Chaetomium fimeti]|jgi:inosine-uridine nucleoside N-ribohydrolase|uniref:Inosine/uridine-preferring nucleoside hydrolase domain-containing protein n=1 Tax=Chaetomium fimeti TaxID=1854472 RepID=A0AAE0LY94_9PEZI|nr:Inosine/uridine-preferring nucleoside hydrolase domain-containing protein [Chaetomium fimeti]